MIRRPPRSTLFPYTTPLPICAVAETLGAGVAKALNGRAVLADDLPYVTGSIGLLGTKPSYDLMEGCDMLLIDRKSTRLNSSHANISYAGFCLKKKSNSEACIM